MSSLEAKLQRRQLIKQQWEKVSVFMSISLFLNSFSHYSQRVSQLTASDIPVCSEAKLQQQCSSNGYLSSLLLMVIDLICMCCIDQFHCCVLHVIVAGSLGEAVCGALVDGGRSSVIVRQLAVPEVARSGPGNVLMKMYGIDSTAMHCQGC